ncbi:MAG: GntR family transcriptional regulator [Paracoccaceae bacterium]
MAAGSADKAFRALKRRMRAGDLPIGERLNESTLARDIGVSRTPLREALNRLVGAGLLRTRHGEGFQDRGHDHSHLRACRILRRDLLWLALTTTRADPRILRRFIAQQDTRHQIQDAPSHNTRIGTAHRPPRARCPRRNLRDAQRFVLRLAALSRNGAMVRQIDNLNTVLAAQDRQGRFVRAHQQHDRLILALAFHQTERAWMTLHALLDMPRPQPTRPCKTRTYAPQITPYKAR